MEQILEIIKEIRLKKGYSQEYLASKIGMTQGGYALIEKGERGLLYKTLIQIALIFEMDVCEIIKYKDFPKENIESFAEKVFIQIEVQKEKKDQVLNIIYGDNNLKISNK